MYVYNIHMYAYKFAFKLVLCVSIHLLANYFANVFLVYLHILLFASFFLFVYPSVRLLLNFVPLSTLCLVDSFIHELPLLSSLQMLLHLLYFSVFTSWTMYLWFVDGCQIYALLHQFLHTSICLFTGQCSICLWMDLSCFCVYLYLLVNRTCIFIWLWTYVFIIFNSIIWPVYMYPCSIYMYVYLLLLNCLCLLVYLLVSLCWNDDLSIYSFLHLCVCVCFLLFMSYLSICLSFAYLLISSPYFLSSCSFAFLFVHFLTYSLIYFC